MVSAEPKRMGRPATYTPEERIARRKLSKAASDRRCKARKGANSRKYRAAHIAQGLTGQGKPRANPKTKSLRPFMTDLCAKPEQCTTRRQSTEEWLANGGKVERIPAKWQAPTRYPMFRAGFAA